MLSYLGLHGRVATQRVVSNRLNCGLSGECRGAERGAPKSVRGGHGDVNWEIIGMREKGTEILDARLAWCK